MTASDDWVILQGRVVGPSLTAAGLAAWVLAKNRLETEAAGTRELQDVLDSALHSGTVGDVRVPRATVERAALLWETAADLLESWSESAGGDVEAVRNSKRLRVRIGSLRHSLECDPGGPP